MIWHSASRSSWLSIFWLKLADFSRW